MGSKRKTLSYYKQVASSVHNGKYDYSRWDSDATFPVHSKVVIICPTHGVFHQTIANHVKGAGCPKCRRDKQRLGFNKKPKEFFIKKAIAVHGNKYDYSLWKDVSNTSLDPVTIVCRQHGPFTQTPASHIDKKAGCSQCGRERSTIAIRQRTQQHIPLETLQLLEDSNWLYDQHILQEKPIPQIANDVQVSDSLITSRMKKHNIEIRRYNTSTGEREVAEFIQSLGVDVEIKNRSILGGQELDIYIPEFDVAIEFNGLFWHSEANEKYENYHLSKTLECEKRNIRLIHIFEDEWKNMNTQCKHTLAHLFGKSSPGVYARNITVREIPWNIARDFLNKHHLLGAGTAGNFRIGGFDKNNNLIGVMVFGQQNNEHSPAGVTELKRFVTDKNNNPGLGSKMFKWAISHKGYNEVIAFVDRRWFTGLVKSHIGFGVVGTTPPAIWWTNGYSRFHRRFNTKHTLLQKYPEFDSSMSKRQMLHNLGFYRIWDCGKIKLSWQSGEPHQISS
jgi:hypothetical protein